MLWLKLCQQKAFKIGEIADNLIINLSSRTKTFENGREYFLECRLGTGEQIVATRSFLKAIPILSRI